MLGEAGTRAGPAPEAAKRCCRCGWGQQFLHAHRPPPTPLQALREQLVPSALGPHCARLLALALARLRRWPAGGQVELAGEVRGLVFEASVAALFGPLFLGLPADEPAAAAATEQQQQQQRRRPEEAWRGTAPACSARAAALERDFFAFEAGFELAASPVPHALQPRFLAARRRLLAALRCAPPGPGRLLAALLPPCVPAQPAHGGPRCARLAAGSRTQRGTLRVL